MYDVRSYTHSDEVISSVIFQRNAISLSRAEELIEEYHEKKEQEKLENSQTEIVE